MYYQNYCLAFFAVGVFALPWFASIGPSAAGLVEYEARPRVRSPVYRLGVRGGSFADGDIC